MTIPEIEWIRVIANAAQPEMALQDAAVVDYEPNLRQIAASENQ